VVETREVISTLSTLIIGMAMGKRAVELVIAENLLGA
jgi:hypothetical protein